MHDIYIYIYACIISIIIIWTRYIIDMRYRNIPFHTVSWQIIQHVPLHKRMMRIAQALLDSLKTTFHRTPNKYPHGLNYPLQNICPAKTNRAGSFEKGS